MSSLSNSHKHNKFKDHKIPKDAQKLVRKIDILQNYFTTIKPSVQTLKMHRKTSLSDSKCESDYFTNNIILSMNPNHSNKSPLKTLEKLNGTNPAKLDEFKRLTGHSPLKNQIIVDSVKSLERTLSCQPKPLERYRPKPRARATDIVIKKKANVAKVEAFQHKKDKPKKIRRIEYYPVSNRRIIPVNDYKNIDLKGLKKHKSVASRVSISPSKLQENSQGYLPYADMKDLSLCLRDRKAQRRNRKKLLKMVSKKSPITINALKHRATPIDLRKKQPDLDSVISGQSLSINRGIKEYQISRNVKQREIVSNEDTINIDIGTSMFNPKPAKSNIKPKSPERSIQKSSSASTFRVQINLYSSLNPTPSLEPKGMKKSSSRKTPHKKSPSKKRREMSQDQKCARLIGPCSREYKQLIENPAYANMVLDNHLSRIK